MTVSQSWRYMAAKSGRGKKMPTVRITAALSRSKHKANLIPMTSLSSVLDGGRHRTGPRASPRNPGTGKIQPIGLKAAQLTYSKQGDSGEVVCQVPHSLGVLDLNIRL